MLDSMAAASQANSSGGLVLLVDDDPQVLNAYGRILRTAGMSVVQASDGARIGEMLAASPFDAVISDIRLQGSSGIGVLRAVRAFDPDLPVVLITAGGDLTSAVDAVTHGALRYLLKPVPPALLSDSVRDAIRLRRLAVTKRRAFELFGSAAVKETQNVDLTERFDLEDQDLLSTNAPLTRFASRVVLEITERASLTHVADLKVRLVSLRQLGYRLAIDDLGAGYAGLTSFTELEPEVVKLDMSLTRSIDREPTKQKLVASMTRLCNDLGILVVAEGVETPAERDALAGLGCDLLQGYHFAKPGPAFPTPDTTS